MRRIQAMALDVYRKKRKFDVTPEPRGRKARGKGNRFVIQKHAATRLHYDLRLELDGVMKSWAVTRGPSLVPGEKRLAVETEDHPVEYNAFEGTIPKGEYGGGTVMIWDRGTWEPEEDPHRGLKKGHLDFSLDGEKLHGHWHLVRMRGRPGEKRNNWLLIKANDEAARTAKDADILEEMPESVVSGRSIEEIAAGKGKQARLAFEPERQGQREGRRDARRQRGRARRSEARARSRARASREEGARARSKKRARTARAAGLRPAVAGDLARQRAERPGLGARDQVRRLSHAGAARSRQGQAAHPQGPRLDRHGFRTSRRTSRGLPADTALIDGEIVVENERGVVGFLDAAGGAEGRRARALSSITCSTCCISTARICPSRR